MATPPVTKSRKFGDAKTPTLARIVDSQSSWRLNGYDVGTSPPTGKSHGGAFFRANAVEVSLETGEPIARLPIVANLCASEEAALCQADGRREHPSCCKKCEIGRAGIVERVSNTVISRADPARV